MLRFLCTLLILLGFLVGCQRSAEFYFQRGRTLMATGKYEEASLNFRAAIQKNPRLGEAYYQLAVAEFQLRRSAAGYQDLLHAAELLPDRTDVKVKLAEITLTAYLGDRQHPQVMRERLTNLADELIATNPKSLEGLRLKGYLAMIDKNFREAEQFFEKANEVQPMDPMTILGWGRTLFQDGQTAEGEKLAIELIEHNKTYTPIYDLLYQQYASAGRRAEAESILVRKAANNPSDANAIFELAAFYALNGKPDRMKAALEQVLENSTAFPKAHLQVGDFYAKLQRWDDAIGQYEQGANADPHDRLVYLKRIGGVWLAQGKGEQADHIADEILKQDPSDESARGVKASLLLASGKREKIAQSVAEFRKLSTSKPENPVWPFNLGRALAANGDAAGARRSFEEAIKRRPDFLPPHLALGDLNLASGDYSAALRNADDTLAIDGNSPAAHELRAVSFLNLGRYTEARQELARIEKVLPEEVELQLANIERREKNFRPAEERLLKLNQKRPGNPRVISGLVLLYLAENRLDKAESFLEEELQQRPDLEVAQRLRAEVEVKRGKYDLAIEHYQQLLGVNSSSAPTYVGLGTAYRLKGDPASAISNFQKAAALAPTDAAPPAFIAEAQSQAGQKAAAIQSLRQALQLSPDNVLLINNLAYLISDSGGNLDEALALAQKAAQKAPSQPNVADTLGWVYFKKNWNDNALDVFRGLAQKYPNDPNFHYHLGMALLRKGDKATAKVEFQSGLSKKPSGEVRQNIEAALTMLQ